MPEPEVSCYIIGEDKWRTYPSFPPKPARTAEFYLDHDRLAVQPASAITSIYMLNMWLPLAMYALMLVFLLFCDLDKKFDFYVAENAKRQESPNA